MIATNPPTSRRDRRMRCHFFSPQRFLEKAAPLGIKASPAPRPTRAGTLHRPSESGDWTIGRPRKLLAAWAVCTGSKLAIASVVRRSCGGLCRSSGRLNKTLAPWLFGIGSTPESASALRRSDGNPFCPTGRQNRRPAAWRLRIGSAAASASALRRSDGIPFCPTGRQNKRPAAWHLCIGSTAASASALRGCVGALRPIGHLRNLFAASLPCTGSTAAQPMWAALSCAAGRAVSSPHPNRCKKSQKSEPL